MTGTDPFVTIPGVIEFRPEIRDIDRTWWLSIFEGRTPSDVADRIGDGMPGARHTTCSIDGLSRSFILDLDGKEGNAVIWYDSTTFNVKKLHFYEERIDIYDKFRGGGLAQQIVGNIADLAVEMKIPRIELQIENVGGYRWAKAGAVPIGDTTFMREDLRRRLDRVTVRREQITPEKRQDVIDLIDAIRDLPHAIWAVARLNDQVVSHHVRDLNGPRTWELGKELLSGTRWLGVIRLDDPLAQGAFENWRARWLKAEERDQMNKTEVGSIHALGAGLALRRIGWNDQRIARVLGHIPDLDLDPVQIEKQVGDMVRQRAELAKGSSE